MGDRLLNMRHRERTGRNVSGPALRRLDGQHRTLIPGSPDAWLNLQRGFVNLDWPHCAHLFWPHLVGVWGVESRVWSVGVEGCAVDGGEAAVALLGAGAGCAEEVSDLGPRAVLVSGVGDGSG